MNDAPDIQQAIAPKSDQINADDLVNTTRDITVTAVKRGSAEQPVVIHYDGENGRPYKPCKSMCRVIAWTWGEDTTKWVGGRMRLYCDPNVTFGSVKVGGIRISHISGIECDTDYSLTVTRSKRASHIVKPMTPASPPHVIKAREIWAAISKAEHPDVVATIMQGQGKHLSAIADQDADLHQKIVDHADKRMAALARTDDHQSTASASV